MRPSHRNASSSSRPIHLRALSRLGALLAALAIVVAAWPSAGAGQSDPRRQTAPPNGLRPNVPETYALVGADVVVRPGEVIEQATVIVRDGKIAAVGKDAAVPPDAEKVDLKGKRIYAGFIDAYAELAAEQSNKDPTLSDAAAARYWNTNVTPQISAARIMALDEAAHSALRRTGVVARVYAPSAGIIKGTAAMVSTAAGGTGDTAILAEDLGLAAQVVPQRRGFGGGGGGGGYPGSPMGAFALVRQAFYDAAWYQEAQKAVAENPSLPLPERNDALSALAPVLAGEMPVIWKNRDELYAGRSQKVAEEFDLKSIHVGSGYEYRRPSLIAETGSPIILPLSFPRAPDVSTPELADGADLESLMHWDLAPSNPQYVHETGLKMAFTTEGLRRVETEFLANIRKAIGRGLPADAALAALTTGPAEIYGVEDLLGTVEAGKLASFVVVDGDLFTENSRARITETWVNGKRDILVRDPVVDFRGTWELKGPGDKPVKVNIGGRPERLSGNVVSDQPTTRPGRRGPDRDEPAEPAEQPEDRPEGDDPADAPDLAAFVEELGLTAGALQQQRMPRNRQEALEMLEQLPPEMRERAMERINEMFPGPEQGGGDPSVRGQEAGEERSARGGGGPGSLRNLRQNADRLSFTMDAKPFGQQGTVLISLTMVGETVSGTALMPDGERVVITAVKTAPPSTGPTTRPGGREVPAEVAEDEGEPEDAPPTETEGGTTRTVRPDRQDAPETEMEAAATGPAGDRNKPLYEPNYPLGAWGRETPEAPPQQTVVLKNGTIWTAGPEGIIENGYVIIADGKIAAVGSGEPDRMPESAEVIDLEGRHVSPGIIDAHSHIASDSGINEGSQAITCEVRLQDYVNPDDINIYRQLAGGTTMANVLHGSANPIGGQNVVIKFRWGQGPEELIMAEAPKGVKFALGENVKRAGGGGGGRYPGSRMGVPEIVADAFRAAQDYQRAKAAYKGNGGLPVRTDLELEALSEMLSGERLIHCHSYRQDEILAMLRVLEEFDIQIGSLQHILEGYKVASEMANHAKDVEGNDGLGATASTFSDWWAYKMEVYDAIPYNGAIMHNAGVVVSFNSDDAELARRLNTEAAKAVKYGGVPEEEAIKFVTLNPAKQLRIDEYVGSLEAGKHADVVIWTGSPLSTKSRVEQTWIDGRKYFDREEDLKKREQVREMRAALIQRALGSGEPAGPGETPVRETYLWAHHDLYCGHGLTIEDLEAMQKAHEGHDHE
jgi:N-acetylglucosamine-6-phosphate deacetylase